MASVSQAIRDIEDISAVISVVALCASLNENKKRKRRVWVKKWIQRRQLIGPGAGTLHLVHDELAKEDPASYRNFLRMDEVTFNKLLQIIRTDIQKNNTNMRESISARDRLSVTLRFLATGESYKSLMYSTRIPDSTISLIIPEVCQAMYKGLQKDYLQVPKTEAEWKEVAKLFNEVWNYPNCLGALDGKHISFNPPKSAGSVYWNYKDFHSIVLMGLVDANYKFIYINVGVNGRVSDGGVYRDSNLARAISDNTLNIPANIPLPGRSLPVPYVIVADDAFTLSRHIMKPYPLRNLSIQERVHNYRLSRARRTSENAFGILANRFRIFLTKINLSPEKVKLITLASCALHNFLRVEIGLKYMPLESIDRDGEDGSLIPGSWRNDISLPSLGRQGSNRTSDTPHSIRQEYKEYFNKEGAVPWQIQHIFNC